VADAARMREVAEIVCAFPDELPCIVMSAMGKSTNLLLEAGRQSIEDGTGAIGGLPALRKLEALHREACGQLGLGAGAVAAVEQLLTELQQLLTGLSIMQARAAPMASPVLAPCRGGGVRRNWHCKGICDAIPRTQTPRSCSTREGVWNCAS
jgi:hypothetical protein